MKLDNPSQVGFVVLVAMFLLVLILGSLAYGFAEIKRGRARTQRMDLYIRKIGGNPGDSRERRADQRRKQISNKVKSLQEGKKHASSRIGFVRIQIVRAGFSMGLTKFWTVCLFFGLACTAAWSYSGQYPAATPMVFLFTTIAVPQVVLRFKAGRRQKEFTKYFSTAIDIIVRGLKSGLPPQECFRIIGREIPDPCGELFRTVINEVYAGLTMEEALERSAVGMPTQELRFFSTVISVQAQTGGNLAEILGNISMVLRGRAALQEKIKALSSEAKMSSIIVGVLPFFVGGVLCIVNPAYISLLWTTQTGKYILAGALGMMAFGMFVMNRMGKLEM